MSLFRAFRGRGVIAGLDVVEDEGSLRRHPNDGDLVVEQGNAACGRAFSADVHVGGRAHADRHSEGVLREVARPAPLHEHEAPALFLGQPRGVQVQDVRAVQVAPNRELVNQLAEHPRHVVAVLAEHGNTKQSWPLRRRCGHVLLLVGGSSEQT